MFLKQNCAVQEVSTVIYDTILFANNIVDAMVPRDVYEGI